MIKLRTVMVGNRTLTAAMLSGVVGLACSALPATGQAQTEAPKPGAAAASTPSCTTATYGAVQADGFPGGPAPGNPADLIRIMLMVADARVQSVGAPINGGLGRTMTNVTFKTVEVLKGQNTPQFNAAVINTNTVFDMKQGQRFIIFLDKGSQFLRNALPDQPNLPQYSVVHALCVEDGKVRTLGDGRGKGPLSSLYGATLEKALSEIRSALNK